MACEVRRMDRPESGLGWSDNILLCEAREGQPLRRDLFVFGSEVHESLSDAVSAVGNAIVSTPEGRAVQYWLSYLGILSLEMSRGTCALLFHGYPRAAVGLSRTLFEYYVRSWHWSTHPEDALSALQRLPKRVYDEERKRFGNAVHPVLQRQYEEWERENPDLAQSYTDAGLTILARRMYRAKGLESDRFANDIYLLYGRPSIVLHGKPQFLRDVVDPGHGGQNGDVATVLDASRTIAVELEMFRVLSVARDMDHLLSEAYGRTVPDLSERWDALVQRWNNQQSDTGPSGD